MSAADQRIERILDAVMANEGGARTTNDPADAGGATRFGITEAVARANGYTGAMRNLPESLARAILRKQYIDAPRFGDVAALDTALGAELIDTGVNMGPVVAATFLQRLLNAFNDGGGHYAALRIDGCIGGVTLDALRAFIRWRGPQGIIALLRGFNGLQATRYLAIAEMNPSQRRFLLGWLLNRVAM